MLRTGTYLCRVACGVGVTDRIDGVGVTECRAKSFGLCRLCPVTCCDLLSASWGSSSDVGDWGSEEEEEDEEDELVGDDETFIRSLGLGGNKEGLIGDFTL
jgi:hypothetical protein